MTAATHPHNKPHPPFAPILHVRPPKTKLAVSGWLLVAWTKPIRKAKVAL